MKTFEQLILDASSLAEGATLEQHLNNLNTGSDTLIPVDGVLKLTHTENQSIIIKDEPVKLKIREENIIQEYC